MKVELLGNPTFGHAKVLLNSGERILVESGAMAAMSSDLQLKSRFLGGFFRALLRKVVTGESLMVGDYQASQPSELLLSPSIPGEVRHLSLQPGRALFFQGGAFLACTPNVRLGTQFGGLRSFFSSEGLFFLKVSGQGELLFNSYGAIVEHDVDGTFTVDTSHVVGWEESLQWNIRGMGSLKNTLLSGEGLVIEFKGRGKLWTQTRSLSGLVGWLSRYC